MGRAVTARAGFREGVLKGQKAGHVAADRQGPVDRGFREGVLGGQKVKIRRDLKDLGFFYMTALVVFITASVMFAYVWSRLTYMDLGYEISRLNEQRDASLERNKRLRVELGELKSPERIERIATGEFGLIYPTGERIVHIK